MYRAICFDLFNTLVSVGSVPLSVGRTTADVLGVDARAWNHACFSEHHEICSPTNHVDVIRTLAHQLDPEIPLGVIEDATRQRQARFDYALTHHVHPAVVNTLEQLRHRGYGLALISNASTAEVSAWPDSPLRPLFDLSIFSCDVGLKKPDPQIYHHTAKQLGVSTQACLFVGDGGSNEHQGAHHSGMAPVWLTQHLNTNTINRRQGELKNYILAQFSHLEDIRHWLPGM